MKWICNVCGYEHEGDAPPAECPICGAGPDEFDRMPSVAPAPAPAAMSVSTEASSDQPLRCMLCERELLANAPECPSCGSRLAKLPSSPIPFAPGSGKKRYVIAGGGVAGWTAAERILATDPDGSIVLVTREACVPYYRLSLTRYLGGEIEAASLIAHSPSWWADQKIELAYETEVLEVDRDRHQVRTSRGVLEYDRLVAATGARSFLPPLKNGNIHGVTGLRSLVDARFVLGKAARDVRVAVVGGGVLGLETAYGLARRGCQVTVCEGSNQLLPRQLDARAAAIFQAHLETKGIHFVLGDMPVEVIGDESARGLKLASGAEVGAELVILSAGIRPNTLLWAQAGLKVERGLVVDDALRTSDPDIYAAGDLAEHKGILYGIWPASMEMGRVAGANAAGGSVSFPGIPMSHSLKVVDLDLFSIGSIKAQGDTMVELVRADTPPAYAKLVLDNGVVAGAILLGDTSLSGAIKTWVQDKRKVSSAEAAFAELAAQ